MSSNTSSSLVGIIVAILIVGAVASIGYYQVVVAPNQLNSSSTSTSGGLSTVTCPSSACVNVTIPSGASIPPPGYAGGTTTYGYSPDVVTVVIGVNNTVVWTNNDSAPHTVTSDTPGIFDSGSTGPLTTQGGKYQFTFTKPGNYRYHCSFHAWMQGEIIVLAGTSSGSSPSTTSTTSASTNGATSP
jgi:plastocyanin